MTPAELHLIQFTLADEFSWVRASASLERVSSALSESGGARFGVKLYRIGEREGQLFVTGDAASCSPLLDWLHAHARPGWQTRPDVECLLEWPRVAPSGVTMPEFDLDRFVSSVREGGEVWGLYHRGWARADRSDCAEALAFWPSRREASAAATGGWSTQAARAIALDEFVEDWLTGMVEDEIKVVLGAAGPTDGELIEPQLLSRRLCPE